MSGVEILYIENIGPYVGVIILGILLLIVGLLLFSFSIGLLIDEMEPVMIGVALFGIVVGVCGGVILFSESARNEMHYKVKIEDNVGFNDFMEKYEIVNHEGEIWEVKEIEK